MECVSYNKEVSDNPVERRDFWCVVALMRYTEGNLPAYTNSCAIMLQSADCTAVDLLPELDFGECGGRMDWAIGRPSGLYRLQLASRAYASSSYEGVIDSVDVWPIEVSCLCSTGIPALLIDLQTGLVSDPVTGG